jgi:flagellar hook-associated protein 2
MTGFGQVIQSRLQAGGNGVAADPTATATFAVVGNKLQLNISGGANSHSLAFSAAGDSSNALGILGIANSSATAVNPTITGATNLGVARLTSTLDAAGISGLTSTTSGKLTINSVAISYDTTKDTLSDLITRINKAGAGVVASVDRTNDKIEITSQATGAVAIDIADTAGNLGASLKLAPGTTNAQTVGLNAGLTVDGRSIVSASNTVTNAIDNVALNLVGQSAVGQTETLTVGVDTNAVQTALSSFVSAFNLLGDQLDSLTATTPGTVGGTAGTTGPLANDSTAQTLFLSLRQTVMQAIGSGNTNSLGSLGISTGAVGAAVGTTNRLTLNPTQLATGLTNDPNAAASLLDGASGPLGQLLTKLQGMEDPSNPQAYVQSSETNLADEIKSTQDQEAVQQEMITNYTNMVEAQFTAMEATLATLQAQSAQIAAELGYSTTSSSSSSSSSTGLSSPTTTTG